MPVLETIAWAWPWALLLLPVPRLARRLPVIRLRARGVALAVPDTTLFVAAHTETAGRRDRVGTGLLLAMWCCLVLALARPQTLDPAVAPPQTGRDLMLAIDVSGSMREPVREAGGLDSRLQVVKRVADDFIERRSGDRIGLILFGSRAYVQSPLTLDHAAVRHFLGEAEIGLAGRSTAIGDAIGLAVKRFRDRRSDARVLVLLTDGVNSAGSVDPLDAARVAVGADVRVHTVMVGTPPDAGADAARSALAGMLPRIAEITGGSDFRALDREDLERIYREIDRLEPARIQADETRARTERYAWPLGLALLLSWAWAWRAESGARGLRA